MSNPVPGYAAVTNSLVIVVVSGDEVFIIAKMTEPHKFETLKAAIINEKSYEDVKAIIDPA